MKNFSVQCEVCKMIRVIPAKTAMDAKANWELFEVCDCKGSVVVALDKWDEELMDDQGDINT